MDKYLAISIQLQILFEIVRHPENRPYTLQEVSDATGISIGSLSQLRSGRMQNPQLSTLRELCRFFKVPLRYFETTSEAEAYGLILEGETENKPVLHEIALRATYLSEESQKDILRLIVWAQAADEKLKRGEGLPPLPLTDDSS